MSFDLEFPMDGTSLTSKSDDIIEDIMEKLENITAMNLTPEFILLNKRNYEKLITWNKKKGNGNQFIDEFFGCKIIIWDVPINYINIRCKASVEYLHKHMQ